MTPAQRKRVRSRKYSTARHRLARAEAQAFVASGFAKCARCGEPIAPGENFDVGHDDRYPWLHTGPEHLKCNRGAPHRNDTSRQW